MKTDIPRTNRNSVEYAKTKVFDSINRCISDIEETVKKTGLSMRDIGFDVEKYTTARESYVIEMTLHL